VIGCSLDRKSKESEVRLTFWRRRFSGKAGAILLAGTLLGMSVKPAMLVFFPVVLFEAAVSALLALVFLVVFASLMAPTGMFSLLRVVVEALCCAEEPMPKQLLYSLKFIKDQGLTGHASTG